MYIYIRVYVCTYMCMYVRMYERMYVRIYICMNAAMYLYRYVVCTSGVSLSLSQSHGAFSVWGGGTASNMEVNCESIE